MVDEAGATRLVMDYARDHYGSTAGDFRVNLSAFDGGWLATLARIDGQQLIGGETIAVDQSTGALSTFASGVPPRRVIQLFHASKSG